MFSKFQCWRCDTVTSEGKKCSTCGMAYYCSDRCRINDEFRHSSSECKDVAVRYVCHGCNKKTTEKMMMCTNCMKVWFCDQGCQKKAWKNHKHECKTTSKATIELRSRLCNMNASRMSCPGMPNLYYWGNSPALDLLNLPMNEGLEYIEPLSLLLCGVGDPRSVCLTISKLTEYQGRVTFVLNDICACTLARTVLLLYLLCKGGESKAESVTQIWYSLYLSKNDHELVVAGLNDLLEVANLEDITHGIMNVEADQLIRLKKVWKTWLQFSEQKVDIANQRRQMFVNDPAARDGMSCFSKEIPERHQSSAKDWLTNGMLCCKRKRTNMIKENFTLLGSDFLLHDNKGPFEYCIQSDSMPFNCWDYKAVKVVYSNTDSLCEMYSTYISDVLRTCAVRLQSDNIQLSFILSNCTDMTPYLPEGMTFDRITTFNLWDSIPLRRLLTLVKPLLNPLNKSAVIVTETQNWIRRFPGLIFKKIGPLPLMMMQGTELRKKILQDTGNKAIAESLSEPAFCDYVSLIEEFTSFLRASLLHSSYSNLKPTSLLPSVNQLAAELGLKSRDFTCRKNKVAPFRWTLNCRRVTLLRGSELSIEWILL